MASLGFTYYDSVPVPVVPTIQEIIAGLSGAQKTAILNGFVQKILPKQLAYNVPGLSRSVIRTLYKAVDSIEETSRLLMRGEVIITPGDEENPPVYNTPPASAAALLSAVQDEFSDVFTGPQVNAILSAMIAWSKHDGTGNWTYYSTEVVK